MVKQHWIIFSCTSHSPREILNAKAPEPGGGSRWKPRAYRGTTLTRRPATYNGNRIRAQHDGFLGIQWQISVMPNIVADEQGDDTGRQRANNIPVNAAKIDGIVQFSADFFKSLPFPCQSVLGLIPFGSGSIADFSECFWQRHSHQPADC